MTTKKEKVDYTSKTYNKQRKREREYMDEYICIDI